MLQSHVYICLMTMVFSQTDVVRYPMMKLLTVIFFWFTQSTYSLGQKVNSHILNMCDTPIMANRFPSFSNIPQYFDYEQAIKCQANLKKPLIIYFTGKFSANSRKIEKEVLSDTSVVRLLNNFIIVTLYVDDVEVGKSNYKIQETKFEGSYTPQFVIQPIEGKWKSLTGYVAKEAFINFIHP